jgi:hypothetical protein
MEEVEVFVSSLGLRYIITFYKWDNQTKRYDYLGVIHVKKLEWI